MKKQILSLNVMAEVAILASLGYVLDIVQGLFLKGFFVSGGSIGIAMIPIFVICYRRGFFAGFLTGLIMGLLQLTGGIYAISDTWYKVFTQVALDYWLAYPLCSLAGIFKNLYDKHDKKLLWIIVGCVVGGIGKYLCHFLSGVIFWPSDLWNVGGSILFSIVYNGAYMIPNIIICTGLMVLLAKTRPVLLKPSIQ